MIIAFLGGNRRGLQAMLMDMGNRCAIDQQAEQFRATVVAARVHQALALVDQGSSLIDKRERLMNSRGHYRTGTAEPVDRSHLLPMSMSIACNPRRLPPMDEVVVRRTIVIEACGWSSRPVKRMR